jgi:hypothetical protein
MSKTVEYKGTHFAGSVTFSDPLRIDQEAAFEEAQAAFQRELALLGGAARGPAAIVQAILPGLLACIEKFSISGIPENVTLETWPLRPRLAMVELVAWLIAEVGKLYADSTEPEAPNAPSPLPTPAPAAKERHHAKSTHLAA